MKRDMMPARVDALRRILREYGKAALVSHLTDEEAEYLLRVPAILRGLRPCEHPERIKHGRHEWYIDVIGGSDSLCRACGAICAAPDAAKGER